MFTIRSFAMPNFSSICLQCHPPVQELANSWMLHYFICVCIYDHAIELFNYLFLFIFLNLSECEYDCMKLKHVSAFFVLLVSSASKIIWSFRMKFVLFLFFSSYKAMFLLLFSVFSCAIQIVWSYNTSFPLLLLATHHFCLFPVFNCSEHFLECK